MNSIAQVLAVLASVALVVYSIYLNGKYKKVSVASFGSGGPKPIKSSEAKALLPVYYGYSRISFFLAALSIVFGLTVIIVTMGAAWGKHGVEAPSVAIGGLGLIADLLAAKGSTALYKSSNEQIGVLLKIAK